MTQLQELTEKAKRVFEMYRQEYPDVRADRDYLPFKITEEWGECLQVFLMLSDRGRQKGKTKEEIRQNFSEEFADVFAFLLLFAEAEGIDIAQAVEGKWFKYLKS